MRARSAAFFSSKSPLLPGFLCLFATSAEGESFNSLALLPSPHLLRFSLSPSLTFVLYDLLISYFLSLLQHSLTRQFF